MATTLDNILSEVGKRGLHSSNRYRVEIARDGAGSDLEMFAEAVNIPGVQVSTFEYPLDNVRNQVKVPNGLIIEDISITFMLTNDFEIKKFFDKWSKDVITDEYLLNYCADYEQDMKIQALDQTGQVVYTASITGAYPITVASIPLSYGAQNEYTKLEVTLSLNTIEFE